MLGYRVVRGPDWKWAEQDGIEGCVGTIVSLTHYTDGRTLPKKTVLVYWDTGSMADYRVGLNGCYDLRIFDSAPAGSRQSSVTSYSLRDTECKLTIPFPRTIIIEKIALAIMGLFFGTKRITASTPLVVFVLAVNDFLTRVEFKDFTCDGCMQSNIAGMRWHCMQCHNFDLCSVCYMNDVHENAHNFERYDISNDRTNGTKVGQRLSAKKVQSKGLYPGARVKSGRNWSCDSELGSMVGNVVGLTTWQNIRRSAVIVKWGDSLETPHRVGYEGKVSLFYLRLLPCLLASLLVCFLTFLLSPFPWSSSASLIHVLCNFACLFKKAIGNVGKIAKIDEDGDVFVSFGLMTWAFHPEAIIKVRDLRPGDKVRVLNNKEIVMKYQEGHGGWNNAMEAVLGQQCMVVGVDKDGDAIVNVADHRWLFNAAALVLESKEEERQPPGVRTGTGETTVEEILLSVLEELSTRLAEGTSIEQLVLLSTLGDLDKVKEIIQKDKNLVNQTSAGHKTALHVACHQGNPDIVSYLLENGADKDIRDEGGYTALHHAAYGDKSGACVVIMLSGNANVNVTDMDNTNVTPLHLAIQQDNEKAVAALTQFRHCDVNLQDKAGDTPLHVAILLGQSKNARTILDNRHQVLDPSLFNEKSFNVLHLACIKSSVETVRILIDKYPGLVDMVKEDGFSALHLAALNNRCEIVRMLILSGHCNINLANNEGRTALSIAVGESFKAMIEVLLEHGVNVNAEDKDGDTPLHMAVMKHCMAFLGIDLSQLLGRSATPNESHSVNFAIALYLVIHGADITHRNHQGKTPIDLCIDKRLQDILVQHSRNTRNNAPEVLPTPTREVPSTPPQNAPATPRSIPPTLPPPPPDSQVTSTKRSPAKSTSGNSSSLVFPPIECLHVTSRQTESKSGASANVRESGNIAGPSNREADIPPSLAQGECRELNNQNVNHGVTGKRSNIQISSEIQASAGQPVSRARNPNVQVEQADACRYCLEEPAVVVFEPCHHKVVCQ
ncbi:hypothetical protein QZH41_011912 [Actinostola sp. cb2023]|nr:hypothetical protein QZH41_011912 [Actinostola sp. cb2023]